MRIPKIAIDKVVRQGTDAAQLALGPGHYPSCANGFAPPYCSAFEEVWPGERGRVVVGGHRTMANADFFRLDELRGGDRVFVRTKWGRFAYRVTGVRIVSPADRTVIVDGVQERELVLVTCHPRYSAAQRLIVYAQLDRVLGRVGAQALAAPWTKVS